MKFDPEKHHRRSIRLKGYDYSQPGAYFITICTQNRECLYGDVVNGKMILNNAGKMINKWYFELENKFPDIQCDDYVIMPNHFHAIIIIVGADLCVCPKQGERANLDKHTGSPLPKIVQWFKTMTTNEYIRGVKQHGWSPLAGKLWQRNYYEHIVHNKTALHKIRKYIINNPLQWDVDQQNTDIRGRPVCLP